MGRVRRRWLSLLRSDQQGFKASRTITSSRCLWLVCAAHGPPGNPDPSMSHQRSSTLPPAGWRTDLVAAQLQRPALVWNRFCHEHDKASSSTSWLWRESALALIRGGHRRTVTSALGVAVLILPGLRKRRFRRLRVKADHDGIVDKHPQAADKPDALLRALWSQSVEGLRRRARP